MFELGFLPSLDAMVRMGRNIALERRDCDCGCQSMKRLLYDERGPVCGMLVPCRWFEVRTVSKDDSKVTK